MIQSPWEQATALVTTEREGVAPRQFALTSTQQIDQVPIAEEDIPNLFVSVLLVKGRATAPRTSLDAADGRDQRPGQAGLPARATRSCKVEDASKRLQVAVPANQEEYRPATRRA